MHDGGPCIFKLAIGTYMKRNKEQQAKVATMASNLSKGEEF